MTDTITHRLMSVALAAVTAVLLLQPLFLQAARAAGL
jgi:hypothetical protein